MKTFGLFAPGASEPFETYQGEITVLKGTTVSVLGEPLPGEEQRAVIAEIALREGETLREVK
jgi:hypothetical protein